MMLRLLIIIGVTGGSIVEDMIGSDLKKREKLLSQLEAEKRIHETILRDRFSILSDYRARHGLSAELEEKGREDDIDSVITGLVNVFEEYQTVPSVDFSFLNVTFCERCNAAVDIFTQSIVNEAIERMIRFNDNTALKSQTVKAIEALDFKIADQSYEALSVVDYHIQATSDSLDALRQRLANISQRAQLISIVITKLEETGFFYQGAGAFEQHGIPLIKAQKLMHRLFNFQHNRRGLFNKLMSLMVEEVQVFARSAFTLRILRLDLSVVYWRLTSFVLDKEKTQSIWLNDLYLRKHELRSLIWSTDSSVVAARKL